MPFSPTPDPRWEHLPDGESRPSYQNSLRALGQYLDRQGAQRVNLLEEVNGYTVRYQLQRDHPDSVFVRLSHDEIPTVATHAEGRKRRGLFGRGRDEHGSSTQTYENVLRALGYELDQVEAYSLLIDEVDEGMLVTYQYLRPTEGFTTRKRMVILGDDAVRAVVEEAEQRREQRKQGVLSLLAS